MLPHIGVKEKCFDASNFRSEINKCKPWVVAQFRKNVTQSHKERKEMFEFVFSLRPWREKNIQTETLPTMA